MDSALAWVGQIAEWIGKFFPRWVIVPVNYGGVKYVRGSRVIACAPGIHWYWPATTIFDNYPTARQTDNLPSQTMRTVDGKVITVSGMVIYDVSDIVKLLAETHSPMMAIRDISLAAIHSVCCVMTLDELHTEQRRGTLDTKLKNAAKKQLEDYGVRVMKVQLTDLAESRVLRLVQSMSKDEE
jgi:regulator of protease activity HflC (stomatin/prohibitin superfamily)